MTNLGWRTNFKISDKEILHADDTTYVIHADDTTFVSYISYTLLM